MKKKECPACAMEVDSKSIDCPICGYEFPKQNRLFQLVALLLIIMIVLFLVF